MASPPASQRSARNNRDWLYIAAALTAISGGLALGLMPRTDGLWPALAILPAWMVAAMLAGSIALYGQMVIKRSARPLDDLRLLWKRQRRRMITTLAILLLAGLNMIAFMWMKTLLNYLVPFHADPLLADADAALFLGHDPWRLLAPYAFAGAGKIYHPVWFVTIITLLTLCAWAEPSPRRAAVLTSYFVLWSVAGPVIHCLLPAGGPIFFERLGHGARFADIMQTPETAAVGNYLWSIYDAGEFGAGSGISAMPSMHVTMAVWMVIASRAVAPRLLIPVAVVAVLIALLSVALGWHYAVDGIVGGLCALGVYSASLAWFTRAGSETSRLAAST